MKMRKRTVLIMMALIAALTMFPSCAASAFEIRKLPIDYSKVERIRIETPRRNVRVRTHVEVLGGEEGSISGWIHSYDMHGNTLTIKLGGNLVLTLPSRDMELIDVAIATGSILVEGFDNVDRINAASAEGDITISEIGYSKDMRADSTNGNLRLEAAKADNVKANSISGDITIKGKAEKVELSGISGDLTVITDEIADVSFDTLTGRRNYSSEPNAKMKIKASTISGGLTVRK